MKNTIKLTKEQERIFEDIFYQNKIKINKIFALVLSVTSLVIIALSCLGFFIPGFMGTFWCRNAIIVASAFVFACSVLLFHLKEKATLITLFLNILLILYCGLIYLLLYGFTVGVFVFPILISTMFFDKKIVIINSVAMFFELVIVLSLSIVLQSVSPAMQELRAIEEVYIFQSPRDVWLYHFLPKVVLIGLSTMIGIQASENGKKIVLKQAISSGKLSVLKHEVETASEIQKKILPQNSFVSKDGQIGLYSVMKPAKETAGDFFDYFYLDDSHLVFLVADVSDKGLSAAMYMMLVKNTIKLCVQNSDSLNSALEKANRILNENEGEMFTTLWIGVIDTQSGKVEYVNAGHVFPFVKRKDGRIEEVENNPNLFLGLFGNANYELNSITLDYGERLFLYTDGTTDAMNKENVSFGKERLYRILSQDSNSFEDMLNGVLVCIDGFIGEVDQFDDITMMGIERKDATNALLSIEMTVKAEESHISEVIDSINERIEDLVSVDSRRALDVVIDEIGSNICEYSKSENMTVRLSVANNTIVMHFLDSGEPFNPLEEGKPSDDPLAIGGKGILLMKNLVDSITYERENGLNILKIEKKIQ